MFKTLLAVVLTGCPFLVASASSPVPPVIVSEIMYQPPSTNLLEQWFEVQNTTEGSVDLSGWKISSGPTFTFPANTVLAAGAYLVVAADRPTFLASHPGVVNLVAGWTGDLGGTIELSDAGGQVVNRVDFYDDGDWAERVLGLGGVLGAVDAYGGLGWEWFALHRGLGASLELIQSKLPNSYAQNWGSNRDTNSTPGRVNSIARANVAPFIAEVSHSPVVPQPSDPVAVTARIVDERTDGLTVTLGWRVDGALDFTVAAMFDDGAHGDGLPNDGIFGAILPAQPQATIVEFNVNARDVENNARQYPSFTAPLDSTRTANLLYQVDNGIYSGAQPLYRLIMREEERAYLQRLSGNTTRANGATTDSDVGSPGTELEFAL